MSFLLMKTWFQLDLSRNHEMRPLTGAGVQTYSAKFHNNSVWFEPFFDHKELSHSADKFLQKWGPWQDQTVCDCFINQSQSYRVFQKKRLIIPSIYNSWLKAYMNFTFIGFDWPLDWLKESEISISPLFNIKATVIFPVKDHFWKQGARDWLFHNSETWLKMENKPTLAK